MGLFDSFPLSNAYSVNLDWIMRKIKELEKYVSDYTAVNNVSYAGVWDITKQYPKWALVTDNNSSYLSLQPVPAGVPLENEDYWQKLVDMDPRIAGIIAELDALQKAVTTLDTKVAAKVAAFDNVRIYGAAGDGVADDTAAIQKAIDACAKKGVALYFPAGVYNIAAPLKIGDGYGAKLSTANNITIFGCSGGGTHSGMAVAKADPISEIRWIGGTINAMVVINGPIIGVNISRILLNCNAIAQTGIKAVHMAYSSIHDVAIYGCTGAGYVSTTNPLNAGSGINFGAGVNRLQNVHVQGVNGFHISGDTGGIFDTCRNVFQNCECECSGDFGVKLDYADNNTFLECEFYMARDGHGVVFDRPAAKENFPSENLFINVAAIGGVSGVAGKPNDYFAGGNWFIPYPHADGEPLPQIENVHFLTYDGQIWRNGLATAVPQGMGVKTVDAKSINGVTTIAEIPLNINRGATLDGYISISISAAMKTHVLLDNMDMVGTYSEFANSGRFVIPFRQFYGSGGKTLKITLEGTGTLYNAIVAFQFY